MTHDGRGLYEFSNCCLEELARESEYEHVALRKRLLKARKKPSLYKQRKDFIIDGGICLKAAFSRLK